ncbi:MAG: methyltransferase [Bacteroidetes bacterium]|nr:methyltransferase [Bacteroidota bacterium]
MADSIVIRKLPPIRFIRALNAFRSGLFRLYSRSFPANVVMYERFTAFWILPAIRVAAELDIAGILEKEPMTIEQLAVRTDSNPGSLSRMMRALSSEGIFKKNKTGQYKNTSLSRVLSDGKGSLRFAMMQHLGSLNWNLFSEFPHTIKTGKSAFSMVYGQKIYDYLSGHPHESELFDRSMTNLSEISIEPVLSAMDFSNYPVIADIGGGEGLLLSSILYQHKSSSGILFDLPEGLTRSGIILNKYGVANRVKVMEGTFFDTAPAGADAYILKNILHNWSDEECLKILKNIVEVLPARGKILILEMVIDEKNHSSFGKLIDLQMMLFMEHGKERTRKEFESLFDQAGLRLNKIIQTVAPIRVIEAVIK